MAGKKPHLLTDLVLEELSAVNAGANKGAKIILLKSECDKMEIKDRVSLITKLAEYLNIGKKEGDTLTINTGDEPVSKDLVELQKTVATQGAVILKLAAQNAFAVLLSIAKDALATVADVTGVDSLLAKAKTDLVLLIKSGEITDQAELIKLFEAQLDGDLTERAKARKAELEKGKAKHGMHEFRNGLPKGLQKAFDDMDENERLSFMTKFNKSDDDDPVNKALEKLGTENVSLLKQVAVLTADSELAKGMVEFEDLATAVKLDEFVPNIIKLRKLDKDAADVLVKQTRALAAQSAAGNVFEIVGKRGGNGGDVDAKIDKAVAIYKTDHPDVSDEVAMDKVLQANPALYDEYNAEQAAG